MRIQENVEFLYMQRMKRRLGVKLGGVSKLQVYYWRNQEQIGWSENDMDGKDGYFMNILLTRDKFLISVKDWDLSKICLFFSYEYIYQQCQNFIKQYSNTSLLV